jgi:transloator
VVEVAQMGLQYARDMQKRQGEIVQKARLEAIQQATKDAEAGILGKIFGWIGRIFALIFLTLTSIALVSTGQVGVAMLTITALVLTVLDFCSAISKECGGPDISYAGLIALIMEASGSTKEAADAVRQWLGLAVQVVTAILGAVGGISAAAKVGEMIGKVANAALSLASGATSVASGVASVVGAKERYKLIETQVEEMQAQAFHEVLLAGTKRWAEDLQSFMDDLDAALEQRSDWLSKERGLNVQLAAA